MTLLERANDVLNANPALGVDEALSLGGSDWLWAAMAIYIISFLGILVQCFIAPEDKRVFHYLFTMNLLLGSVTYFAQASDLGWSAIIQADHLNDGVIRQVFFVKYIQWVVSFPSIALALGLLSGISWTTIITNIFTSWLWILTYLAGAYTSTNYKWGFFAFGTFAWVILAMSTINESHEAASRLGIGRDYRILSVWVNLVWLLYPVAWALSDGANVIDVTAGHIFFGVLDVLLLPPISYGFLLLGRNWDYTALNLDFSEHRYSPNMKSSHALDGPRVTDNSPSMN